MSPKSGLLWIVLFLSMSSCVSYKKLSIEVFKPAKYAVPPEIKKLAIVSRNLKYEDDTLQNYHVKNRQLFKDKVRFNSDSAALKICIDSLANKLLLQSNFDSILILPVNLYPLTRVKKVRPYIADWYKNLATETRADGLIILDMFSCFYSYTDIMDSNPTANVVTSNIWSFYDCKRKKITDRFTQIDTLYWDRRDENGNFTNNKIPAKKEAISLAAGVIGENYSKHIQPAWVIVYRDIMVCNNQDLKQAEKLAQKSKWEEASAIWEKYAEHKSKRNQIVALYNLALSSEMKGNVDDAIKFTDRAAKASLGSFWSIENEAIRKYSAVLHQRKNELKKLSTQYELP